MFPVLKYVGIYMDFFKLKKWILNFVLALNHRITRSCQAIFTILPLRWMNIRTKQSLDIAARRRLYFSVLDLAQ